jgi:hypothetical protein
MDAQDQRDPAIADGESRRRLPCRWLQFRLRTLLAVIALCAVAAFAWRTLSDALPYREQRRTAALIAELGGTYQTAAASAWHRQLFGSDLQNLVLVNLADSNAPELYIKALAGLPALETLVVGGEAFHDEHLSRLRATASLRYLVLDSTGVSDEAVAALRAAHPKLEIHFSERLALAVLKRSAHVTEMPANAPEDLKQLVGGEHFLACRSACCSDKVRTAGIDKFRHFKRIQRLVLAFTEAGDKELSHAKSLLTLHELVLGDAPITDEGLANVACLTQLRTLNLAGSPIGDVGLAHLASLAALETLDLEDTQITDAGLLHLSSLKRLKDLDLSGTRCSRSAIERLGQALPECRIRQSLGASR